MIVFDNSTRAYANSRTHNNEDLKALRIVLADSAADIRLSLENNYDFDSAINQIELALSDSTSRIKNRFTDFQDFAVGFDRETLKHDISFQVHDCLQDLYERVEIQAITVLEQLQLLQSEFDKFNTVLEDTLEQHGNLSISGPKYDGLRDVLKEQAQVIEKAKEEITDSQQCLF